MSWLGRATQLVEVTACWVLGVMAGGIVLGWLPAGVAAGSVLHKLTGPEPSDRPIAEFFEVWRSNLGRANAVGWPATIAIPVLLLDLWILSHGGPSWLAVVVVANMVFAAWLVLAVGYLMSLLMLAETHSLPMARLWRTSLVMPLASPGTTLIWLVCLGLLAVVARFVPIVAVLCAPGYVILVTSWLTRRRLHNAGVAHDSEQELLAEVAPH
nr:DUF624 domain-containing protein [Tessaracoccus sp. OS52]